MNAFCYTEAEEAEVKRLRERRRNAIANSEFGLYKMLSVDEATYHGRAYQRWLDAKSTDPILRKYLDAEAAKVISERQGEPFAQPVDTSKPSAFSPELPTVGPPTMAPWSIAPPEPPKLPEAPWNPPTAAAAPAPGPFAPATPPASKPQADRLFDALPTPKGPANLFGGPFAGSPQPAMMKPVVKRKPKT